MGDDTLVPCDFCGKPGHWEHSCPEREQPFRDEISKLESKLKFYMTREKDICAAVGGVSDGGQYRADIIEHLQILYEDFKELRNMLGRLIDNNTGHLVYCPGFAPGPSGPMDTCVDDRCNELRDLWRKYEKTRA